MFVCCERIQAESAIKLHGFCEYMHTDSSVGGSEHPASLVI